MYKVKFNLKRRRNCNQIERHKVLAINIQNDTISEAHIQRKLRYKMPAVLMNKVNPVNKMSGP